METLRTDQSALVRLAPEAHSGSLQPTYPSCLSVSATAEGGQQKKEKKEAKRGIWIHFAVLLWQSWASYSFSYRKSKWLQTWSKIGAWAMPKTHLVLPIKQRELLPDSFRGSKGWAQNTALEGTSRPCSKWQRIISSIRLGNSSPKSPNALPQKLFLNPWPVSAWCLSSVLHCRFRMHLCHFSANELNVKWPQLLWSPPVEEMLEGKYYGLWPKPSTRV